MDITTGTTTTSDGTEVSWDRRGAGTPLVLVHGITDRREAWGDIADQLSSTHTVTSLDLRGHGLSGKAADYGIERLAMDVAEVCHAESLDTPVLVGHSLGGVVVTAAAAAVSARAVVNVDQPLALGEMAARVAGIADALRSPDTFNATMNAMFEGMASPGLAPEVAAMLAAGRTDADQDVVLGIWGPMMDGPDPAVDGLVDAILATVTMPYLSTHGIDPGPDYAGWLQQRVPQAAVEVDAGKGHYVHLLDTAAFVGRVRSFLADA